MSSASRGKSDITLQRLVIEALPRRGLITGYNGLQLVVCYRNSKNGRLICFGTTRYNALQSSAEEPRRYNRLPGFPRFAGAYIEAPVTMLTPNGSISGETSSGSSSEPWQA